MEAAVGGFSYFGHEQEKLMAVVLEMCIDSSAAHSVNTLPTSAGYGSEVGLIPGSGRSPGGGNGSPLQYACLENPTDRGAWRATDHGVVRVSSVSHW